MNIFSKKIKEEPVLFDGAMGTYISALDSAFSTFCERACLTQPELVEQIHREYIESGAEAILTNTFSANRLVYTESEASEIIKASMDIAKRSAGDAAYVFAEIGQINGSHETRTAEYIWISDRFMESGAEYFIFDTQSGFSGIKEAAEHIKGRVKNAYIIASFSVNDAGFTQEGLFAGELLRQMREINEKEVIIDAFGLNCGCSAGHMLKIVEGLDLSDIVFSVMPNSGYPQVINRRTVYEGDPVYFSTKVIEMTGLGAAIIGGCCGTTPAHIGQLKKRLENFEHEFPAVSKKRAETIRKEDNGSRFWDKLVSGAKPVAVELDPPNNADITKFMAGINDLKEAKVDIITIADCPIGRARMDSSLLACKIHREEGVEALPHLTCRDRNLNATQALMLGLYAEGIRNMLLVTGDPVPSAERDEVKAVYQFNSRKFALFASHLSEQMFPSDVHFFGALNVNARNFDMQIKLAKEKIQNGITGFLTQPVLTEEAFENIKRAKAELSAYILGGIIPVVSEKNARFMNSEINGINVDEKITEMYIGKSREEAEELAVEISCEIAQRIRPYVDGYYFMTPFQRTGLVRRILERLK